MINLTIEQLKFAKSIGATHVDTSENPDGSSGCFYRKDSHAYVRGEWGYGWADQAILDDSSCFAKIDFTPLDEYYADKDVDITATSVPDGYYHDDEQYKSGDQQTEWNGEGFPPAGTECEISNSGNKHKWCRIRFMGNKLCVVDHAECTEQHYHLSSVKFRPLRTERERWVESAHKIANDDSGSATFRAIGAVYDALKSGTLKAPEVG